VTVRAATMPGMGSFLLVLEGRAAAHHYHLLVGDVLGRRLQAQRILRNAWILQSDTCENVYRSIAYYTPCRDGVLVIPLPEPEQRFARNLRCPIDHQEHKEIPSPPGDDQEGGAML